MRIAPLALAASFIGCSSPAPPVHLLLDLQLNDGEAGLSGELTDINHAGTHAPGTVSFALLNDGKVECSTGSPVSDFRDAGSFFVPVPWPKECVDFRAGPKASARRTFVTTAGQEIVSGYTELPEIFRPKPLERGPTKYDQAIAYYQSLLELFRSFEPPPPQGKKKKQRKKKKRQTKGRTCWQLEIGSGLVHRVDGVFLAAAARGELSAREVESERLAQLFDPAIGVLVQSHLRDRNTVRAGEERVDPDAILPASDILLVTWLTEWTQPVVTSRGAAGTMTREGIQMSPGTEALYSDGRVRGHAIVFDRKAREPLCWAPITAASSDKVGTVVGIMSLDEALRVDLARQTRTAAESAWKSLSPDLARVFVAEQMRADEKHARQ